MLLVAAVSVRDAQTPPPVPHPSIPCWSGARSWTEPGRPLSNFTTFDTRSDTQPYLITHNRDHIRRGTEVEQDYNFIDYWFGDPANPVRARYYLRNDESVAVHLPSDASSRFTLEEVRARFPAGVLCYLQRRFSRVDVLLEGGYRELWSLPR